MILIISHPRTENDSGVLWEGGLVPESTGPSSGS